MSVVFLDSFGWVLAKLELRIFKIYQIVAGKLCISVCTQLYFLFKSNYLEK